MHIFSVARSLLGIAHSVAAQIACTGLKISVIPIDTKVLSLGGKIPKKTFQINRSQISENESSKK